jgi:pyruvate/2-oxoglutarate/acetoin dehydrogenase E1 component
LGRETVAESVRKADKLSIIGQDRLTGGWGCDVAASPEHATFFRFQKQTSAQVAK